MRKEINFQQGGCHQLGLDCLVSSLSEEPGGGSGFLPRVPNALHR